ncbi:HAD family hydrolase, partial [Piscirickettsia litoralis]|uniref:HAD family hydrolase n=1 Tax=Piscirickettsia litoralis TaxID=1891921 RepID=UPI001300E698
MPRPTKFESRSHREWFKKASRINAEDDPALALFDLGGNILNHKTEKGRMNHKVVVHDSVLRRKGTFYIDHDAFKAIKRLQKNGHKVIVVTNANYPANLIISLFKGQGITLTEQDYYSRDDIERVEKRFGRTEKSVFIDYKWNSSNAMLFDDNWLNEPFKKCLFHETKSSEPFPDLVLIKPEIVACLQEVGAGYDEIWSFFVDNPKYLYSCSLKRRIFFYDVIVKLFDEGVDISKNWHLFQDKEFQIEINLLNAAGVDLSTRWNEFSENSDLVKCMYHCCETTELAKYWEHLW